MQRHSCDRSHIKMHVHRIHTDCTNSAPASDTSANARVVSPFPRSPKQHIKSMVHVPQSLVAIHNNKNCNSGPDAPYQLPNKAHKLPNNMFYSVFLFFLLWCVFLFGVSRCGKPTDRPTGVHAWPEMPNMLLGSRVGV